MHTVSNSHSVFLFQPKSHLVSVLLILLNQTILRSPVVSIFRSTEIVCSHLPKLVHKEVVEERKIKDKSVLIYYPQFTEKQTKALVRSSEANIQEILPN